MLRDAQDIHPLFMSEFDKNIYLLNCQNGTLDLKNNSFYPHKATDFITKLAGVKYAPNVTCDRFAKMTMSYETEQKSLETRTSELNSEIATNKENALNTQHFISLVQKYTDIK